MNLLGINSLRVKSWELFSASPIPFERRTKTGGVSLANLQAAVMQPTTVSRTLISSSPYNTGVKFPKQAIKLRRKCATKYRVVLCGVVLSCVVLCSVVRCCVGLCCTVRCCVILCVVVRCDYYYYAGNR